MEGPPLGPGGEDITWPDQVAPRGRKASSTRKIKPQTSNHNKEVPQLSIGVLSRETTTLNLQGPRDEVPTLIPYYLHEGRYLRSPEW